MESDFPRVVWSVNVDPDTACAAAVPEAPTRAGVSARAGEPDPGR